MYVKVFFPFGDSNETNNYESKIELHKGEVVVVNEEDREKIGVVYFLENRTPRNNKVKDIVKRKADSLDVFDFWREFEKLLLDKGIELTEKALKSYQLTSGNFDTPLDIAKKKLTRNLILSHKTNRVYITDDKCISLQYGALRMYYRNGAIHKIENHKRHPREWKKNEVSYTYFSKLLGIDGL